MFTAITTGLIVFVAIALFLFIARRVLGLAVKLALVAALVLLLLGGVAIGWWRGWFSSATSRTERPTTQLNQRANSNRHPSSR